MKTCTRCTTEKPLDEFYRDKYKATGLRSCCKTCAHASAQRWRKTNSDFVRASDRNAKLKAAYGITTISFDALWAAQGGRCALCSREMVNERGPGRVVVDHDHETGQVRGILHSTCNIGLGMVEKVGIAAFAAYLCRAREKSA